MARNAPSRTERSRLSRKTGNVPAVRRTSSPASFFDHRQLQINVGQHLKRGLRRACRVAQQRQHLLPRSVERMRAHTDDIVYCVPVGRQRLVLHPFVQLFRRDRKNFGVQERRCGAELDEQAFAAGGHF